MLLTFTAINKVYNPKYKNPYYIYDIGNVYSSLKERVNVIEYIFDNNIKKNANSESLDLLNPNTEYTVLKINSYEFRNNTKYVMLLDGRSSYYISNSYFEDEMKDKDIAKLLRFKFKTVDLKRFHKEKNKKEMALKFLF